MIDDKQNQMKKLIAAINMSLDGVCDHTAMAPDAEVHQHYTDLLKEGSAILYGRITYQLMEDFWPTLVKNPSGNQALDDFAEAINEIPKIVFSHTLNHLDWENSSLAKKALQDEVLALKQIVDRDFFVGSPGLIISLMNLNLVDELQICVHPVVVGSGRLLFSNIQERNELKLVKTKIFSSGAIILYYEPIYAKG